MQRHVSNMSQTIIESDEVTSCDISNLVNSIPETPNTVRSSPNTYPESPVLPKYTIQRKTNYTTAPQNQKKKTNSPCWMFTSVIPQIRTIPPTVNRTNHMKLVTRKTKTCTVVLNIVAD